MTGRYPDDWDTKRRKVYRRDDYTCQNCGRQGGSGGDYELHAHHIVPISDGGSHRLGNLRTLCKDCHNAIHQDATIAPTSEQSEEGISDEQKTGWSIVAVIVAVPPALVISWIFSWEFGSVFIATVLVVVVAIVIATRGGEKALSEVVASSLGHSLTELDDLNPDYREPPDQFFGEEGIFVPYHNENNEHPDLRVEVLLFTTDDPNDAELRYYENVQKSYEGEGYVTIGFNDGEYVSFDGRVTKAAGSDFTVSVRNVLDGETEIISGVTATFQTAIESPGVVKLRMRDGESITKSGYLVGVDAKSGSVSGGNNQPNQPAQRNVLPRRLQKEFVRDRVNDEWVHLEENENGNVHVWDTDGNFLRTIRANEFDHRNYKTGKR